ncbi:DUF5060 domain-containing protein [Paenibacillus rigui]|uniref:DUF5060 domain-containing protein n=1 Tax=Paenibacillus rigui TaxID=554312 RepID=A0A229UYF0_9BACL|nr:DUF5060 domain-containing protein [Paenibacillus rigui]OXM87979.1 DUF5060 domain-containing protein [Paenibacillus rigui]
MNHSEVKRKVEQWGRWELTLEGPSEGNPFQEVTFGARFQFKNRVVEADGFYDGEGKYRIRFMPDRTGAWSYVTRSNCPQLHGLSGEFNCVGPSKGNHGPVRVNLRFGFVYEDGKRYLPFGTTCYHWTHDMDEQLEELTLQTLQTSPFNKIRMCLLPTRDMCPPAIAFAGTCPEDVDRTRFNPSFFRHLERRLDDLQRLGIEADLVLFHPYDKGHWGFDGMSWEEDTFYLKYVISRLAAYRNVWWSLSNEYDFNKNKTVDDWDRLIQYVRRNDPYEHLRSIHNGTKMYKSSMLYDFNKPWITHQSIQHWDPELTTDWRAACPKPVVIDEISYEGNSSRRWGNISGQELTHRFWEAMSRGGSVGHGESFNGMATRAWISTGGVLYGEAVERIAFLRRFMEEGPADWIQAKQDGTYGLYYFGRRQPVYYTLELSEDQRYKLEFIDTWNMTIEHMEGTCSGKARIRLPGKPYFALRVTIA